MFSPVSTDALLDAMTDEVAILDAAGVIVHVNAAWKAFCTDNGGDAQCFYIGTNYLDLCGRAQGPSDASARIVREGIERVLSDGVPFRTEYPCHSPTQERWFELTASRIDLGGSKGALVLHRNITTRYIPKRNQPAEKIAKEMLAALVACSTDAILTYGLDGRITSWNRAAHALYGYREDEIIGQPLSILYPPDWPVPVEEYRDRIIAGELAHFEAPRMTKSGKIRQVQISGAPVRMPSGEIVAISNIHRDVTDLRRAEETQRIVAREATHRAKNMLTVVRAIQRQTTASASSLEDFNRRFAARLDSLASTTDLLVDGNWTEVALADLVRAQLSLFLGEDLGKVAIDGPDMVIKPDAVQVVGMALHELATNCAKHGALARGDIGDVGIRWHRPETDDGTLRLEWIETGTAFEAPPRTRGFGHVVLTRLAQTTLDTSADLTFGPDGLRWYLDIPAGQYRWADG